MNLSHFHYELPPELIARHPLAERSSSRLLQLQKKTAAIQHGLFTDISDLLQPGDLLVCNQSRVIPARMFGHKKTGGQVEVLLERIVDARRILVQLRVSKKPKVGDCLFLSGIAFEMRGRKDDLFELICHDTRPVLEVIESIGEIPLPPYLLRKPDLHDPERYQTIYAEKKGSVAAPTAGLHFDEALFAKLRAKKIAIDFVTLHVGAGTFAPVRVDDITQHVMHAEYAEVSPSLCEKIKNTKAQGGKIVAVGTTTARTLESASLSGEIQPFAGDTRIFIYPGFDFHCVDALITNFHLPCSTLIMLVAAFAGYDATMQAYRAAVEQRYRFYSYGDAMWVG